jgi:hypothetical protein
MASDKGYGIFELTKSTLSYSWALSLLGLQETYRSVSSEKGEEETQKPAAGLSPEDRLEDLFKAAFEAGDHFQRELMDSMAHYAVPNAVYNPSSALHLGSEFFWDMADSLRFFRPDSDAFVAWREILNKVDVYQLVRSVQKKLRIPREGEFDLSEYVDKAYALGPYAALWAVEGLGHDYADSVRERGGLQKDLLRGKRIAKIPAKSLLMLHAGIGLSFAQRLLAPMNSKTPPEELHSAIDEFLKLCHENSAAGYSGAAIESLGLVARTFHSELIPAIDQYLMEKDEAAAGLFWHGAGRAIYFLLVNFLPYRNPVWRAVEMGREEAPHEVARRNVIAGTAWALTLVNMRHPQVMASFLEDHGDDLWEQRESFINGVQSSIIMRFDTSPDDEYVGPFRNHLPDDANRRPREMWQKMIKGPIDEALDRFYSVLEKNHRLDEVFRCQDLGSLVEQLEAAGTAKSSKKVN